MAYRKRLLPSVIFFTVYFAVMIISLLALTLEWQNDLFNFKENSKKESILEAYEFISLFIIFVWLGYKSLPIKLKIQSKHLARIAKKSFKKSFYKPLLFVLAYLFLMYFAYEGNEYFIRDSYIPENRDKFIYMAASFFGFAVIYLIVVKTTPKISFLYFLFFLIIATGTGSRFVFLYLVTYLLLFANFYKESGLKFYLPFAVFAFYFSIFLLSLRSLNSHGLIDYISIDALQAVEFIDASLFFIFYMFEFSFYVLVNVMQEPNLPLEFFFTAVNPMPGVLTNWYEIGKSVRLNEFAPYSSIGELYLYGNFIAFGFAMFTGVILRLIDYFFSKSRGQLIAIFLYFVVMLLSAYFWQYNLRSFIRIIYYFLFLYLFYLGTKALFSKSTRL